MSEDDSSEAICPPANCVLCGCPNLETVLSGIRDWEFGVNGTFGYKRCSRCKQVQLDPIPSIESLKLAYPPNYSCHLPDEGSRGTLYKVLNFLANRSVLKLIESKIDKRGHVLDVGCGDGQFLACLGRRGYIHLYGVDFNPDAVKLALSKNIQSFCGLFLEFPSEPESFDLVIMNNYFEHVLDPPAELRRAKALLREGGLLVGETPNFDAIDRRIFHKYWGGNHAPRHTFQYGPNRLRQLLIEAGFKNVSVTCQPNTGTLALSVQNILQANDFGRRISGRLRFGRAWYFLPLLVIMIPVGLTLSVIGRSGVMKFEATS